MRTPRLKLKETAVYHCTSRILEDRRLLNKTCKDHLLENLFKWADFCGVEVLAFSILDDHYHVLSRVEPVQNLTSKELDRRFRLVNNHLPNKIQSWENALRAKDSETLEALTDRMGDISQFLKEFKQSVTPWINAHHNRRGPLWFHRFTSMLVEERLEILNVVAAYIDLNPVRARLVKKPGDYPWCTAGHSQTLALPHKQLMQEHLLDRESPLLHRIPAFTLGRILGTPRFVLEKRNALPGKYRPTKRHYAVTIPKFNPNLFTTHANPRLTN